MVAAVALVDQAAAVPPEVVAPLAEEETGMVKRAALILAMVALLASDAWALARHAVTATAKNSGSSNLVVLGSGALRVLSPGATASAAGSGATVTVYSSSTIQVGDTVKVNGFSAEVLTVPGATSFTIDTDLSWAKGDRFLRTSSPITIYRDAGGSESITQPASVDSNGRLTFFYDASATPTFDLEVQASSGLRMVDHSITNPGEGTSAGGWTDNGATVTLSTGTDSVGIGGAPSATKLELVGSDTNLATATTPTCVLRVEGDTNTTDFCWFLDENGDITLFSYDDSRGVTRVYDGTFNHVAFGDLANVDTTNPGTVIVRNRLATHRGLVLSGASSQSANMLEIRDSTEAVKISCTVAGACTLVDTLAAGNDVTATDDVTAGDDVIATDDLRGADLVVTGTTAGFRGLTYTMPSAHATNGYLKNDGTGVLTWSTISSLCAPISVKLPVTTLGTETEFFSLNSHGQFPITAAIETGPTVAQMDATESNVASWRAPTAFTLSNYRVATAGAYGSGQVIFTVMVNGSATGLACTMNSGTTSCTDADTAAVTAGQSISIRGVATSAAVGTVVWISASFCMGV